MGGLTRLNTDRNAADEIGGQTSEAVPARVAIGTGYADSRTSASRTDHAKPLGSLADDLFVLDRRGQPRRVRQVDAWPQPYRPSWRVVWPTASPLEGKPRADRAVQRGRERQMAAMREDLALLRDIGIERDGRA